MQASPKLQSPRLRIVARYTQIRRRGCLSSVVARLARWSMQRVGKPISARLTVSHFQKAAEDWQLHKPAEPEPISLM